MKPARFLVLLGLGLFAASNQADARLEASSQYSLGQTFSAALRFLRVDRGYEIVEKDPEAAYLLFRYPLPGGEKSANGSVEVVETSSGVKFYLQLPRLPAYHEALLRDGLLQKLHDEYGAPPEKPPSKSPSDPKPGTGKTKAPTPEDSGSSTP